MRPRRIQNQSYRAGLRGRSRPVGFALLVVSLAITPLAQATDPNTCDPVVTALETALAAYADGAVESARTQVALAASLLEDKATGAASPPHDWPRSNGRQLLDHLAFYDAFVRGTDADRDARMDWVTDWVAVVDALNCSSERWLEWRGKRVDYDPFSHLARRIGDMAIDYDPFTHQIRRVGDVSIDYDPFLRVPRRIGDVGIDHDPFTKRVRRVAGVTIR